MGKRELERQIELNEKQRAAFLRIVRTSRNPGFAKRAANEIVRLEEVYHNLMIHKELMEKEAAG